MTGFAQDYNPTTSFANEEANNASGRSTVKTVKIDTEFANISESINSLNQNLKLLQRDDGKLKDLIIEPYALAEQTRALIASRGNPRGLWKSSEIYRVSDCVEFNNIAYLCYIDHTSSSNFDYNLWMAISSNGSAVSSAVESAASAIEASEHSEQARLHKDSAATSAATATTKANEAATSANSASASANSAMASKNSAATSEANAATFAATAENKANEATTAYNSFAELWLGGKSSNPTANNNGGALLVGSCYFNTISGNTFVWNGTTWASVSNTSSSSSAATSAATATTKANEAATSANSASASANSAMASKNSAATSEANAATFAATAENKANEATTAYNSFAELWLGGKSSNPTANNNGGALLVGSCYFNTISGNTFVWNGTTWASVSNTSSSSSAATSAATATTKANEAATSANSASASANSAMASKNSAATSEANAATFAATAENKANEATTAYNSFAELWLGGKSSNPTANNNGGALLVGSCYFNTISGNTFVWNGTTWASVSNTSSSSSAATSAATATTKANEAATSANSASASANSAMASKNSAATSANEASISALAAASIANKWLPNTTYNEGNVVWSPIDFLTYRCKVNSINGIIDPSSDTTNWTLISSKSSSNSYAVSAYVNGSYTVSGGGVYSLIPFNAIEYDAQSCFDLVNNKYVAQNSGIFRVNVRLDISGQDKSWISVFVNGIEKRVLTTDYTGQGIVGYDALGGAADVLLNEGDYVQIYMFKSNVDITVTADSSRTYFQVSFIGANS